MSFKPQKLSSTVVRSPVWQRFKQRFQLLYNYILGRYRVPKILYGYFFTQALYVATKLELADHLANDPKNCHDLATDLQVNEPSLCHLMRLLNKMGLVKVDRQGNYCLTSRSSCLRTDTDDSLTGTILSLGISYQAWGNLLYSVQTGQSAFDETFHQTFYDYLHQDAKANHHFNLWMEETTREWIMPTLELFELSNIKTFVDVGGNTGLLTAMILQKYPHLQAILFDQAHVVTSAGKILEVAQVSNRCQVIGGSFFESIPSGGDLYIISRVLLNWDDTPALSILKNCRAAMGPSSRLLIIDFVLPNKGASIYELANSLHILVMGGGHLMRTEEEYYDLLSKAGFQSPQLIKTGGMISFIEAMPV